MLNYWDADPEQRPTFAQLVTTITSVLDLLADYLDVTTFITGDLSGARGFNQLSVLLSLFHSSLIPSSAPSFITTCSAWLSLFCCPSWLYSHISTLHHLRLWDSLFCLLLIVLGIVHSHISIAIRTCPHLIVGIFRTWFILGFTLARPIVLCKYVWASQYTYLL